MKDFYLEYEAGIYLLADLHLSKEHFEEEDQIIEDLKKNDHILIIVGDTYSKHFGVREFKKYHKELYEEIMTYDDIIFINGNNDPDCSDVDSITFNKDRKVYTIMHGHQLCYFTRFKFIDRFLNLFKKNVYRGINTKTLPDYIRKKLGFNNYIIGHFHQEATIGSSHLLAPRKVYKLDELI